MGPAAATQELDPTISAFSKRAEINFVAVHGVSCTVNTNGCSM